ncbi:MAG: Holliday junction resolvase [Thermoplasmata archaeon]|nr:Holliday junction resolvase [Thermoplasmata archaeon]
MGRGSSAYERELKELLQADPETIARYRRSVEPAQRERLDRASRSPFLVIRAAGSLGFDLVALRSEFAFPIEVKSSGEEVIRFSAASGRAAAQLEAHRKAVERVGLIVLYAFRRLGGRRGDPWRLFSASAGRPGRGSLEILRRRLPPVERTKEGNAVLRWENGMPLLEFLELVAFLTERPGGLA